MLLLSWSVGRVNIRKSQDLCLDEDVLIIVTLYPLCIVPQ